MAHSKWCGRECIICGGCNLDNQIPCSPDCDNLVGDKIKIAQCIKDGCEEIYPIFNMIDSSMTLEERAANLIEEYGEIAEYPYSV